VSRRAAYAVAGIVAAGALWAAGAAWAGAPDLDFRAPPAATDAGAAAVMRDLAIRLLPVYQEADPDRYLANLSALQLVAGDFTAADASRESLRERRGARAARMPVERGMVYDLYAHARAIEAENRAPFAESFTKAYHEVVPHLDDAEAYALTRLLEASPAASRDALQKDLDQLRSKDSIGTAAALDLIWLYLTFDAYRSFQPLVAALDADDDRERYVFEGDIQIEAADGDSMSAVMVRPKKLSAPLPALLELKADDSPNDAKECAAHGYVGIVVNARGTRANPRKFVPYQHDTEDARSVIEWIGKQSWSDGRVAMVGEGYSGFTAWAAAARPPAALKAIATSAPSAPGIDLPMDGSVFRNSAYRWSLQMTDNAPGPEGIYQDEALWRSLDQKWYRSGERYRDFGRLFGKSNPLFIRWLNHPSYDRFWQQMIPYRQAFAHIKIPVLTGAGYYGASTPAALYYFSEHSRYDPHADHTLVLGPYDDDAERHGPAAVLRGYRTDAAAFIGLRELRYQWLDYVLKGAAKPALLKDRVNYEVMGANRWRHAASLEAMSGGALRLYVDAAAAGETHRLTRHKNVAAAFIGQTVSLTDRKDENWVPSAGIVAKAPQSRNGLVFVSEPMGKPTEFDGIFSGSLDFTVNKMDLDLYVALYERLASGEYIRLFDPAYAFRASYARDRVHRHLLKAGERQTVAFKSERITSRQLAAGSRLVMVLGIDKRPDREINYGTGGDVSEESIADGKVPIKIRWYANSYIDIPVRR
jgi:putative CocE/NonD family hydrolase